MARLANETPLRRRDRVELPGSGNAGYYYPRPEPAARLPEPTKNTRTPGLNNQPASLQHCELNELTTRVEYGPTTDVWLKRAELGFKATPPTQRCTEYASLN